MSRPFAPLVRAARAAVLAAAAGFTAFGAAQIPAVAQTADVAVEETVLASGSFARKRKGTSGGWEIVQRGDERVLRLADDFRTGRGPDIKIFLSPTAFADANGGNATQGALLLGQLDSNRGAAALSIPADADLSAFSSVLVHCEEFSVLFGGAPLTPVS